MKTGSEVVVALYANVPRGNRTPNAEEVYKWNQRASFTVLKEWVRLHITAKPEMHRFVDNMTTIEGRGFLFEFYDVDWGNGADPFYWLLQGTLDEMADTFNCKPHSNCSTDYALEYAYLKEGGEEYDVVRLGAVGYALGVKIEMQVSPAYILGEDKDGLPF